MSVVMLMWCALASAQTASFHGQASTWITSRPDISPVSQAGIRYIPELMLKGALDDDLGADADLSLNGYMAENFATERHAQNERNLKLYRSWVRLASSTFELRIGLQRISFGSATIFRPLMWFDRIDPRDPLQLTDGVYAVLARYYFLDNANIWAWILYGNNEPKGLELVPTERNTVEFGGRVQTPLWTGELGMSVHHRRADLRQLPVTVPTSSVPEDRLALDGKWDVGLGVWFEAVLIHAHTDIAGLAYQRQWTLGADYTFDLGNGLTFLTEYFRSENPDVPFGPADGLGISGWTLNYPFGVIDRISVMVYHDWTNHAWYRIATWQRAYDNWTFYLVGFWNPENFQLYRAPGSSSPYAGTGFQLMVVFNH